MRNDLNFKTISLLITVIISFTGICQDQNKTAPEKNYVLQKDSSNTNQNWFIGTMSSIYISLDAGNQTRENSTITFNVWNFNKKHSFLLRPLNGIFTREKSLEYFLNGKHFYTTSHGYLDVFDASFENTPLKVYYTTETSDLNGVLSTKSYFTGFEVLADTSGIKEANYFYQSKIGKADYINNEFIFSDGSKFDGFVQIMSPMTSTTYLEGNFKNGKATGIVKLDPILPEYIFPEKKHEYDRYYEFEYSANGKLITFYSFNGVTKTGQHSQLSFDENGGKIKFINFNENGKMAAMEIYKNGYITKEEYYFENGTPNMSKTYVNNSNEVAECNYYCPSGGKKLLPGTLVSEKKWYPNGKLKFQGATLDGKNEGEIISYHDNGQIEHKFTVKNGKKVGQDIKYYKSGKVQSKCNYVDGEKVKGSHIQYDESGNITKQQ